MLLRFPPTSIPRRTPIQDGLLEAELCTSDYISNPGHLKNSQLILQWSAHRSMTTAVSSSLLKTISNNFGVAIIRWARMTSAYDMGGLASHVTVVFFHPRIPGSLPPNFPDQGTVFASTIGRLASFIISTNNATRRGWASNVNCDAPQSSTQKFASLTEFAGQQKSTGCKTSSASRGFRQQIPPYPIQSMS